MSDIMRMTCDRCGERVVETKPGLLILTLHIHGLGAFLEEDK